MPRGRTDKILEIKQKLLHRLRHGFYQPGDRFFSNRAAAKQFGISYQTAHRLICELCDEGHLERRPQSGTYVPGARTHWVGAELIFNRRAERAESFGAKLLDTLTQRLDQQQIDWTRRWHDDEAEPADDRIPVVWESPQAVRRCVAVNRAAVLINDRPERGIASLFIDSVSTDDRSGGACAADLLREQAGADRGFAILAGPRSDPRAQQRVEGFRSMIQAPVLWAEGWFLEDGLRLAKKAVAKGRRGIFCCNDRLAQSVVQWCEQHDETPPPLVGFDNAPVAESLDLTTIAIPWDELVDGVVRVLKQRLAGDRAVSSQQIFNPRPIIRSMARDR